MIIRCDKPYPLRWRTYLLNLSLGRYLLKISLHHLDEINKHTNDVNLVTIITYYCHYYWVLLFKVFALLHMLSEDLDFKVHVTDETYNLYKHIKLTPQDEVSISLDNASTIFTAHGTYT